MYQVSRQRFNRQVCALLNGESFRLWTDDGDQVSEGLRKLCPTCDNVLNLKTGTNA